MAITINGDGIISGVSTFSNNTATFSGNVGVAGTLTYEDVTNVDSVGLITARSGVILTGGDVTLGTGVTISGETSNVFTVNTNGSERVRVSAGGSLGLGTSSPDTDFEISKSTAPVIRLRNSNTSLADGADIGKIQFYNSDLSGGTTALASEIRGLANASDERQGELAFRTNDSERVRIDYSGRLLVGTSSGHAANRNAFENATTGQLTFRHSSATAGRHNIVGMTAASAFVVADATGLTGVQLAYSGTSWSTLSDERFKTDLASIESGLNKVATLRALTGRLVTDPEDKRRSFLIAQDVDAVLPEAVDKTDPEALALSYTEVVPLLVAALKESKERIETLESEVAALKAS